MKFCSNTFYERKNLRGGPDSNFCSFTFLWILLSSFLLFSFSKNWVLEMKKKHPYLILFKLACTKIYLRLNHQILQSYRLAPGLQSIAFLLPSLLSTAPLMVMEGRHSTEESCCFMLGTPVPGCLTRLLGSMVVLHCCYSLVSFLMILFSIWDKRDWACAFWILRGFFFLCCNNQNESEHLCSCNTAAIHWTPDNGCAAGESSELTAMTVPVQWTRNHGV